MNRRLVPLRCLAGMLLAAVLGLGLARAAEGEAAPPPARVGQLSFLSGTVRMQLDAATGWQAAELNTPLVAGAALATEPASRVEVRVGSAALRAGVSAQFSLAELDDTTLAAEIARGSLALRVRSVAPGERTSLGAEGVRLVVLAPGAYRAEFAPRQHRLTVHVLEGQARLQVGGQETLLTAPLRAVVDTQAAALLSQSADDERRKLDDFSDQRDRRTERSVALRHLPPEMTGAESLDGQGLWRNEPGLGAVWLPENLPPDWAPYRFGRWRWIAPYGWTWVDDAPWGFAPFHYGRWLFLGGRWAWVPGTPAARAAGWRPVFAPALVGFYGHVDATPWNAGSAGPPVVGWYPLAPGEVYWPGYSSHLGYVRSLNAASVADASQIRALPEPGATGPAHRFARTAFAATAVPLDSFRGMQPVGSSQLPLAPAALAQAPLAGRRAPPALQPPAPPPPTAAAPAPAPAAPHAPGAPKAARVAKAPRPPHHAGKR